MKKRHQFLIILIAVTLFAGLFGMAPGWPGENVAWNSKMAWTDGADFTPNVAWNAAGGRLQELTPVRSSLEDVFVDLVLEGGSTAVSKSERPS